MQQYGSGEPFHPVLEALGSCAAKTPRCSASATRRRANLVAAVAVGQHCGRARSLRQELVGATPERMLREMGEFLDRYTEDRPLLLITEDLHWSDRPTVQLIDFLARRRSGARLMWLSSFRLAEVIASDHPLNALRHELRLHGLCEEIVLDSFSEEEVAAYLADGCRPSRETRAQCELCTSALKACRCSSRPW